MAATKTLEQYLEAIEQGHPKAIDLGLERIRTVAQQMRLETWDCPVVTVGGTNGKGSTVKLLSTIYQSAGFEVCSHYSPHLIHYNERMQINNIPAKDEAIIAAFEAIDAARGQTSLTYFEYAVLASLYLFKKASPDVLILEIGLGGRLDAVNLIDPNVSVITTIGFDHMGYLGDTLEKIAIEKSGIFRQNGIVVLGPDADMPILHERAAALSMTCKVAQLGPISQDSLMPEASIAIASEVVESLQRALPVSDRALHAGIALATMPGRFQCIHAHPLIILDVAHNPQGAQWLSKRLKQFDVPGRTVALWTSFADKDLSGIVDPMLGVIDEWHVCSMSHPRSASDEVLGLLLQEKGAIAHRWPNLAIAKDKVMATLAQGDRLIVFGGFEIVSQTLLIEESQALKLAQGSKALV